ncbi:MAG: hypothetical protein ABEI99_00125 [Halobaculum sp.]
MPEPSGYETSYESDTVRSDCVVGVGLDVQEGRVRRFLVDLQYTVRANEYTQIARFDHNELDRDGHDIRTNGFHIDVVVEDGSERTVVPEHHPIPQELGVVVRACKNYLNTYSDFFVAVYEGEQDPSRLPNWPP